MILVLWTGIGVSTMITMTREQAMLVVDIERGLVQAKTWSTKIETIVSWSEVPLSAGKAVGYGSHIRVGW